MASRPRKYYPAIHITSGLTTQGKEWMLVNGTEYKGPYHKYVDGFVMTESTYNPSTSEQLIPYKNLTDTSSKNSFVYDGIKTDDVTGYTSPKLYRPKVTDENITSGILNRYIVQRRNDKNVIIEVSEKEFNTLPQLNVGLNNVLYKGVIVPWKIKGPIYDITENGKIVTSGISDTNNRTLIRLNYQYPGIRQYLSDLTEFMIS